MIKDKVIEIPIFGQYLLVLFGDKEEAINILSEYENNGNKILLDDARDFFPDNMKNFNGWFRYSAKYNVHVLYMPKVPNTVREYGTLVHECQHFTYTMLQNVGVSHDNSSDEVYSYLLAFVFEAIDCFANEIRESEECNNS